MIKEPLYLNGKDVRITAVASTESLPEDMPMELKKVYMFQAMKEQKPEGYCTCEMGYLIDQVLFNCTFYVIFLERDSVINIIKPALDEGREVIIGDADNKEFTIPEIMVGFRLLKGGKASGIGAISNDILKAIKEFIAPVLTSLFNK